MADVKYVLTLQKEWFMVCTKMPPLFQFHNKTLAHQKKISDLNMGHLLLKEQADTKRYGYREHQKY